MGMFRFDPQARYRMPVLFGPTAGPRQGPAGETYDGTDAPFSVMAARFLSTAQALNALLPRGFALAGDPVVTVEHTILHDLAWLAGRSYSMLGVKLPVTFTGADETLTGALLTVLWENRPEPILSGREELGFNKLFADLPEPQTVGNTRTCRASWDGHGFFQMQLTGLAPAKPPKAQATDGTLHYAYMPPMGQDGSHEGRTRVMLSPAPPATPSRIVAYETGEARLDFIRSSFQQMPTMFHIVNALADLPMLEMRGGFTLRGLGKSDLQEQRMVPQAPSTQ